MNLDKLDTKLNDYLKLGDKYQIKQVIAHQTITGQLLKAKTRNQLLVASIINFVLFLSLTCGGYITNGFLGLLILILLLVTIVYYAFTATIKLKQGLIHYHLPGDYATSSSSISTLINALGLKQTIKLIGILDDYFKKHSKLLATTEKEMGLLPQTKDLKGMLSEVDSDI